MNCSNQATQTTTGSVPSAIPPSTGVNHHHQQQQILSVPTETQTTTTTTTHQHQNQPQLMPNKVIGNKKGADKSRKERNRYAVMRQAPAGSQANTTQQYPPAEATPPAPEKTIDVDSETDSNHDTALTMACAGGHEELVELLITRGASIEHRDKKGFTPLILAATAGHEKVVNTLLKQGAEIEAQSERTKDTPLSLACSGGRYEVVEILLGVGANKEHRNVSDYTPLSLAASGGYVNIIKLLLTHGAEINSRTGSKLGISPLMLAAMNGHTAAVKMLLDMGSDINAQIETNRNTALTLACFQGRHEVVSLLLDRKANVEHRAKTGLTPLMEAASGGYIEVGRVLLDKGADVNAAPVPSSRDTALTIAADKGHLKFVDLLLNRGAAVEVKNKKGNSPLWLAANGGHLAVVKVLYTHVADIDSQDNRRVSCLMAAFRKGHTKVVEWMVNHVTQFPSDQEMTRYISTVNDKELLEKCLDCVKNIRAAKEAQAVKANKNASILLEELDMERNREESRKAAAARRRERKKKKKLEKKEEKRKLLENTNEDKDESDKEEDSDKEDVPEPSPSNDKEEGDSGIDGSCSSTEAKMPEIEKSSKSKKNKNKKNKESRVVVNNHVATIDQDSVSIANTPVAVSASTTAKKKDESNANRNKSKDLSASKSTDSKVDAQGSNNKYNLGNDVKKEVMDNRKEKESNNRKEKENVAPKEEIKSAQKSEKKFDVGDSGKAKTPANEQPVAGNSRKSLVFGASRAQAEHEYEGDAMYFNSSKNKQSNSKTYHHDDTKNSNSKHSTHLQAAVKREDGWKEVIRKSSIQQQAVTVETACKKVQVPVNAISRVIGRAGSNINAIRAATGAHIEVEKQGKNQSDRWITIKGSLDSTKQAHVLITALIKDPDVDILQMLPRVNVNAKPTPPISSNVWEKTVATSSQSGTNASSSTSVVIPKSKPTTTSSSVSTGSKITIAVSTKMTRAQPTKTIYTSSQSRTVSITNVTNRLATAATSSDSLPKRIVSNSQSTAPSVCTKTTMSYTNAIMAFKNPKPIGPPSSSFTQKPSTTPVADKKSTNSTVPTSQNSQQHTVQSSPKHHFGTGNTSNIPAPFSNIASSIPSHSVASTASSVIAKSQFTQNSNDSTASSKASTNVVRAITPIGQPISRTITPSPHQQHPSSTANNDNPVVHSHPTNASGGLANQLQTKINQLHQGNAQAHEYSLFNDSYRSQWENNKMYNANNNGGFMENESLPKADASKAPGYRGTNMSSPVSSKTSSNSTTPPNSQQNIQPGLNISVASSMAIAAHQMSPGQQSQLSTQQSSGPTQNLPGHSQQQFAGECQPGIIKPPSQQPIQPPISNSLAVQRPNINSSMQQSRQIDSFNMPGANANSGTPPNNREQRPGFFDNTVRSGSLNMMGYNQVESIQSQFHQQNVQNVQQRIPVNPLHVSRLNPRASEFSSLQNSSQQQQQSQLQQQSKHPQLHPNQGNYNVGLNNYQKLPFASNQIPQYNPAPGRPQSQPQSSNERWFSEYNHLNHTSPREILNIENGIALGIGSPTAMSPNATQNIANGAMQNQHDDSRKMPRPIGTERASWKYGNYAGVTNLEPEIVSQPVPWLLDKVQQNQQQPMPQAWMQQQQQQQPQQHQQQQQPQQHMPRNAYVDDIHLKDFYQVC